MNALLRLYPGDGYLVWVANVLLHATVVLVVAWCMAIVVARKHAAARYATWFVGLVLLFITPWTAYLAVFSGVGLAEVPLAIATTQESQITVPEAEAPMQDLVPEPLSGLPSPLTFPPAGHERPYRTRDDTDEIAIPAVPEPTRIAAVGASEGEVPITA